MAVTSKFKGLKRILLPRFGALTFIILSGVQMHMALLPGLHNPDPG